MASRLTGCPGLAQFGAFEARQGDRKAHRHLVQELPYRRRSIDGQADHLPSERAELPVKAVDLGHLLHARRTPAGPEIQHQRSALGSCPRWTGSPPGASKRSDQSWSAVISGRVLRCSHRASPRLPVRPRLRRHRPATPGASLGDLRAARPAIASGRAACSCLGLHQARKASMPPRSLRPRLSDFRAPRRSSRS